MKTVLCLILLSSIAHADPAGQQAYAKASLDAAGLINRQSGTYQSGWARGLTPQEARQHAEARFNMLPSTERDAWTNIGRSSPSRREPLMPSPTRRPAYPSRASLPSSPPEKREMHPDHAKYHDHSRFHSHAVPTDD